MLGQTLEHYTQWNTTRLLVVTRDPDITVHRHHDQQDHHEHDKAGQDDQVTVSPGCVLACQGGCPAGPRWKLGRHCSLAGVSPWAVSMCVVGVMATMAQHMVAKCEVRSHFWSS